MHALKSQDDLIDSRALFLPQPLQGKFLHCTEGFFPLSVPSVECLNIGPVLPITYSHEQEEMLAARKRRFVTLCNM